MKPATETLSKLLQENYSKAIQGESSNRDYVYTVNNRRENAEKLISCLDRLLNPNADFATEDQAKEVERAIWDSGSPSSVQRWTVLDLATYINSCKP